MCSNTKSDFHHTSTCRDKCKWQLYISNAPVTLKLDEQRLSLCKIWSKTSFDQRSLRDLTLEDRSHLKSLAKTSVKSLFHRWLAEYFSQTYKVCQVSPKTDTETGGGGGGFLLACDDLGRMFDNSFPRVSPKWPSELRQQWPSVLWWVVRELITG